MSQDAVATERRTIVSWVGFPDKSAVIKRLIVPGGTKGLLLRTATSAEGDAVLERAKAFGFKELPALGMMRMLFPDGKIPFSPKTLAAALGGKLIAISPEELVSERWTINLSDRMPPPKPAEAPEGEAQPAPEAEAAPRAPRAPVLPDPEAVTAIGLNMRGEEVVRDGTGRFFRRVEANGRPEFVAEDRTLPSTLFLRAAKPEDLPAIAAGLVAMAGRGTLHSADLGRVLEAAFEEGPHGRLDMSADAAREQIRVEMIRQITAQAVAGDAAREQFLRTLRVSLNANLVTSRAPVAGQPLEPSLPLLTFARRLLRGVAAADVRVGNDLGLVMPRGREDGAAQQVHDLTAAGENAIAFAMNVIARRPAEGSTIFLLPGKSGADMAEMLRGEMGRAYALDAVADISPAVAAGHADAEAWTAFFVGARRPEPLKALPQAALRTFPVVSSDDLVSLELEINRARSRIKDFHQGVEDKAAETEDARVENVRQRPYQPLSRIHEPFTMIPVALEGATALALEDLRRNMDDRGGVDAVAQAALGQDLETLKDTLRSEQVDALTLRIHAAERGRGFLIADQTGVGKGRSLASIARAHLRANPNNKVLYFTESAQINVPDVCRDLKAVGAFSEAKIAFLSTNSHYEWTETDPVSGKQFVSEINSMRTADRKALFESGEWPDGVNCLITTYSMFNSPAEDPRSRWIENALGGEVMVITDEAHNGLNPKSNTGRHLRAAQRAVGPENFVFGTATPLRDPKGTNFYAPLLPRVEEGRLNTLLEHISAGGEVAQEAFATMLAEDGVMIRRDHDLSNIEFKVALPDDERMLKYQTIMDRFSPIVEMMINISQTIGEHTGRRQAVEARAAINAGVDEDTARSQANSLNQYSIALGSPLSMLARIAMNAIKIDQVVDESLQEIREGRKPLISFHSTNEAIFGELAKEAGGVTEEGLDVGVLTLKDQIRRIHTSIYRIKDQGEVADARQMYVDVAEQAQLIDAAIAAMDDDLPVSPVDALVERLEANGVSVGEVSGRTLCYRDGMIRRREGRDRKATIDKFNSGQLDVMIFNAAGATGGSYHASADFKDQRPRTMIELETPTDIIKYVQGLGRGNRYGQVVNPRIKSVMTGLTPEMRILQQRNRKLRSLGASVDGNRSHPMLFDDVPDLLNKVGDEAVKNVLISLPAVARRLGFSEIAEEPQGNKRVGGLEAGADEGSGTAKSGIESLSNKVLTRSIVLSAKEQDDLVNRIRLEFDAMIEELDSRNANPLKPKMLDGRIEVMATDIFSGTEAAEGESRSAFLAPLYISTGIHHFDEQAWTGDQLVEAVESCRRLYGADGFAPWAERVRQNIPNLLRPYLREGLTMEQALADPQAAGNRFHHKHEQLQNLAWLLEQMVPGRGINVGNDDDVGAWKRVIVGFVPPKDPSHFDLPSAYRIETIEPGSSKTEKISLSRLMQINLQDIRFPRALSQGIDEAFLAEYDRQSTFTRRMPVQILHGNILEAISTAANNDLGTVSLYRNQHGRVLRGIVVAAHKIDMTRLPAQVPSAGVAAELTDRYLEARLGEQEPEPLGGHRRILRLWGSQDSARTPGDHTKADLQIMIDTARCVINLKPLRKGTYDWYAEREGLYEELTGRPLPAPKDVKARAPRGAAREGREVRENDGFIRIDIRGAEGRERVVRIVGLLEDSGLLCPGAFRRAVSDVTNDLERILNQPHRIYTAAAVEEAENVEDDEEELDEDGLPAPLLVAEVPAEPARNAAQAGQFAAAAARVEALGGVAPVEEEDDAFDVNEIQW